MPKIPISGELCLSTELYNCLLNRGVLKNLAEPEEFMLYLQECISRDNISFLTSSHINTEADIMPEQDVVTKPDSTNIADEQPEESSSTSTKINKDELANSLALLYRR